MDLTELNSSAGFPTRKPWLNIVSNTLECQDEKVHGRITQQNGLPTPYSLWACTGNFSANAAAATYAMGTFVGLTAIPVASVYPGMTVRLKIGGLFTTPGASVVTFSIRNTANTYTYLDLAFSAGAAVAGQPFDAECDLQVAVPGGAGVGLFRGAGRVTVAGTTATSSSSDAVTFDSTGGVDYALYIVNSTPGNTIVRQIGLATVLY